MESQEAVTEVLHLVPSEAGQVLGPHLVRGRAKGVTGESEGGGGHQTGGELEECIAVEERELTQELSEETL